MADPPLMIDDITRLIGGVPTPPGEWRNGKVRWLVAVRGVGTLKLSTGALLSYHAVCRKCEEQLGRGMPGPKLTNNQWYRLLNEATWRKYPQLAPPWYEEDRLAETG